MSSIKFLGLSLLAAMFVVSCGDKTYNKLTSDQKARFGDTINSVGRTLRAGIAAKRPMNSDSAKDLFEEKMSSRIASQCLVDFNVPKGMPSGGTVSPEQDVSLTFKISNSPTGSCPVMMDLRMKASFSNTQVGGRIDWEYGVKDKDYLTLNDISGVSFHGSGKMTMQQSGQSAKWNGTMGGKGSITSVKDGVLPINLVGSFTGEQATSSSSKGNMNGSMALTVEYPTFAVELKATVQSDGTTQTTKYYLNGEEMTQDQFQNYFKKGGLDLKPATGLTMDIR